MGTLPRDHPPNGLCLEISQEVLLNLPLEGRRVRCPAGHDFVTHRDVEIYLRSQCWPPAGSELNPSSRVSYASLALTSHVHPSWGPASAQGPVLGAITLLNPQDDDPG